MSKHAPMPHSPERCAVWQPGDDDPCTVECPLFAAAPEMLEALKLALEWIENVAKADTNACLDAMPNDYQGRRMIRAAIAKAEGR